MRARLQQIKQSLDPSKPFNRITAGELASDNFDLTYLIDGVLVKDQPAGLVAPKKLLKTNISIDLAVSLATGGKFLGYFRVAEPKRMAVFSGESGMATIQETALRVRDAAGVPFEKDSDQQFVPGQLEDIGRAGRRGRFVRHGVFMKYEATIAKSAR